MPEWIYPSDIRGSSRGYYEPGHLGIDYLTPVGMPMYATRDGSVLYSANERDGFGNVITLRHPDDWRSLYAHLSEVYVGYGEDVRQGQVIGLSGGAAGAPGAGNSSGPHLHFQIMGPGIRNSENTVDPAPLLREPTNGPLPGPGPGPLPGPIDLEDDEVKILFDTTKDPVPYYLWDSSGVKHIPTEEYLYSLRNMGIPEHGKNTREIDLISSFYR